MMFLVPLISAAVETALTCESVVMFVAGASAATTVFSRRDKN